MSGHNKWSSIKHRKGAQDAKRGKLFTKIIREIHSAVRDAGADPVANPRLRMAIQNARGQNMPQENINRAIKKAQGGGDGARYEKVVYEGYGPLNAAVVIEAMTDNRNRTASSLRATFNKHNGSLGGSNSVLYMFDHKGWIRVPKSTIDEDTLTEYVAEAGAEDLDASEADQYVITTSFEAFEPVKSFLEEKEVPCTSSEIGWAPQSRMVVDDRDEAEKVLGFLELLEDDDDVQNVYTNFEIGDAALAELSG